MKKFISILLTAVLLCTLLSVFVLPASAEELTWTGDKVILDSGRFTDNIVLGKTESIFYPVIGEENVPCNLVITPDASVTFKGDFTVSYGSTVLIRDGATVTFGGNVTIEGGCKLTIEGGATVTFGGMLTAKNSYAEPFHAVVIESGAVVALNKGLKTIVSDAVKVCGTLTGKCESFSEMGILLAPGGTVDLEFTNEADAKRLVDNLQNCYETPDFSPYTGMMKTGFGRSVVELGEEDKDAQGKQRKKLEDLGALYTSEIFDPHAEYKEVAPGVWRVTAHVHAYPGCKDCGGAANGDGDGAGSILSGGSLAIICTIVSAVVFLAVGALGMYLVMKKKKPVLAGEKNEE